MATKAPPATFTPLVAEGLRLRADAEMLRADRVALVADHDCRLKALDAEMAAIEAALIALGSGRYRDEAAHTCTVVAGLEPTMSDDRFELKDAEAEARARELAGDFWGKLFDRHVYWTPCDGFGAVAPKILTPAKARDIVALTLIPGQLGGGRRAYVRWK